MKPLPNNWYECWTTCKWSDWVPLLCFNFGYLYEYVVTNTILLYLSTLLVGWAHGKIVFDTPANLVDGCNSLSESSEHVQFPTLAIVLLTKINSYGSILSLWFGGWERMKPGSKYMYRREINWVFSQLLFQIVCADLKLSESSDKWNFNLALYLNLLMCMIYQCSVSKHVSIKFCYSSEYRCIQALSRFNKTFLCMCCKCIIVSLKNDITTCMHVYRCCHLCMPD